jgi:hypothetical protein
VAFQAIRAKTKAAAMTAAAAMAITGQDTWNPACRNTSPGFPQAACLTS